MDRLLEWCERHTYLDLALARLRRIVPERSAARTAWALRTLSASLELHMRQEERLLLPAYAPLCAGLPANAAPRVFEADHARIRALLAALEAPPVDAAAVLAQQRDLCLLAGALEHHDLRERRWLKATLDAHVPAPTRRAWIRHFLSEEAALARTLPRDAHDGGCLPAPPPIHRGQTPLASLWLAVAQDAPLDAPWRALPIPAHDKGARIHARCGKQIDAIGAAQTCAARRDQLALLSDQLRLLALSIKGARARAATRPPPGRSGA